MLHLNTQNLPLMSSIIFSVKEQREYTSEVNFFLIKMSSDDMNYNEYLVVEEFLENDDLGWILNVR